MAAASEPMHETVVSFMSFMANFLGSPWGP
jgi:hypothetical protein